VARKKREDLGMFERILGITRENMGELSRACSRRAYKILVGRPRHIWEDNLQDIS
jgi:hypothetical protein